jgi:hypothetical protein
MFLIEVFIMREVWTERWGWERSGEITEGCMSLNYLVTLASSCEQMNCSSTWKRLDCLRIWHEGVWDWRIWRPQCHFLIPLIGASHMLCGVIADLFLSRANTDTKPCGPFPSAVAQERWEHGVWDDSMFKGCVLNSVGTRVLVRTQPFCCFLLGTLKSELTSFPSLTAWRSNGVPVAGRTLPRESESFGFQHRQRLSSVSWGGFFVQWVAFYLDWITFLIYL